MVVSNQSKHIGVFATIIHAATEKLRFNVIYHPRFVLEYIMEGSITRQFLAKALVSKESSKVFLL
jgi:hypothetical protein